ncbi:hypothetical protein M885DRAFT_542782 [Pelagophyceae sp. CCMP2097]|nr:hypothetical protein M885DRAFT_542782 [Pelagophyceae sp. CCMP2097]|mmetsp:Transcript_26733/g.91992  ORF Transcript_26733/g.91992 Transcript_26733/m.91992 type:complete len:131 (-) Transcript_26733:79-471(-)
MFPAKVPTRPPDAAEESAGWQEQELGYRSQITALEEEQATLRDAWREIVRGNLATVEDLKKNLAETTRSRDAAQAGIDALVGSQRQRHSDITAALARAKLTVAELSSERDEMQARLLALVRKTNPSKQKH